MIKSVSIPQIYPVAGRSLLQETAYNEAEEAPNPKILGAAEEPGPGLMVEWGGLVLGRVFLFPGPAVEENDTCENFEKNP